MMGTCKMCGRENLELNEEGICVECAGQPDHTPKESTGDDMGAGDTPAA